MNWLKKETRNKQPEACEEYQEMAMLWEPRVNRPTKADPLWTLCVLTPHHPCFLKMAMLTRKHLLFWRDKTLVLILLFLCSQTPHSTKGNGIWFLICNNRASPWQGRWGGWTWEHPTTTCKSKAQLDLLCLIQIDYKVSALSSLFTFLTF